MKDEKQLSYYTHNMPKILFCPSYFHHQFTSKAECGNFGPEDPLDPLTLHFHIPLDKQS